MQQHVYNDKKIIEESTVSKRCFLLFMFKIKQKYNLFNYILLSVLYVNTALGILHYPTLKVVCGC